MRIEDANSEPFWGFHHTREELDRTIKLATGAIREFQRNAAKATNPAAIVKDAVASSGEPWGNRFTLKKPALQIDNTIIHLSGLWVSAFVSAFHYFLDGVVAELNRWAETKGENAPAAPKTDFQGNIALRPLYMRNSWDASAIDKLLPAYQFFETMRNCVVHRAGLASPSLAEQAKSEELAQSLLKLPAKQGRGVRTLPEIPKIVDGIRVSILPRHSILASEVCYRLAVDVNQRLVSTLGTKGIIWMATYHSIMATEHPARASLHHFPEDAIVTFLHNRYRVPEPRKENCINSLRAIGKWDTVKDRFRDLYPGSHFAKSARPSSKTTRSSKK